MKASFGEYGAFQVRNGVRFNKTVGGKTLLVKETEVPVEVADLLKKRLNIMQEAIVTEPISEPETQSPVAAPVDTQNEAQEVVEADAPALTQDDFIDSPQATHIDADYLDSISIHSASLKDMAQALYDRFGVYTVWLGRLPEDDEVNPFTSAPMTKYEKGLAYQAFIRASHNGTLAASDPETLRKDLDAKRDSVVDYQNTLVPVAETLKQARDQNSFEWRTSVRGGNSESSGVSGGSVNGAGVRMTNDDFTDEPLVEPKIGGAPVIRPNW